MNASAIRQRLKGCHIFVVPYCHADWAWTHTRQWHKLRYVHVFERVLEIMRHDEGFRWYFDSYITELAPLLELRPDLLPELRQRVAEGRIAICGAYANIRPNMTGEETFIRNLIHGRRRLRALFPEADLSVHADIVDVALGHPQIPQLLKLAGYRYGRFWRPQAGLSEAGVPYEFIWRGLDGSEILCSRGCYAGLCSPNAIPDKYAENWDAAVEHLWQTELELISRHSPTGLLWLSQGMDDALPLQASYAGAQTDVLLDIPGFIAEWNRRENIPMRFATPVEFYQELEKRRADVPLVGGTLDPCDVCYNAAWGGAQGLWRKRFVADAELVGAQLWEALLDENSSALDYDRLWENVLLFSAHATQWLFQRDFEELEELADYTILQARQRRRKMLQAHSCRLAQPPNCAGIIFNSLPYARREIVPVLLTHSLGLPESLEIRDAAGKALPHQIIQPMEYGGRLWEAEALVELEVPACGYTTVGWQKAASQSLAQGDETSSQGPAFSSASSCRLLNNGLIEMLWENGPAKEISWNGQRLKGAVPWGGLRLYDVDVRGPLHVGPITATYEPQWETGEICEQGPLRWRARAQGHIGPHELRLEARLYARQPRVEFALTVFWAGHDGFLAALCPVPFAGLLEADTPFGVEEKRLAEIRYGHIAGHFSENVERLREGMFYAKSFVSLSDGERGLSFITHNGDRYFIYDATEKSLAHILINSVKPIQEGWEQHVNLRREGRGRHDFLWSIMFHPGDWRQAHIRQWAERLRQPLEIILPQGTAGELPGEQSLLSLQPPHVVLSALYQEQGFVYVRLWEAEGRAADVQMMLPWPIKAAQAVDFNDEPMAGPPLAWEERILRFPLRPWEIATVRLTRA